jgi:transcriptional regulator with XRE-family HTH domain
MMSLKAWRHSKVLSIEDLAKVAGVSNKTITDIEHGRVRPKFRTIRRLSEALGVEPGEIEEFARVVNVGGE